GRPQTQRNHLKQSLLATNPPSFPMLISSTGSRLKQKSANSNHPTATVFEMSALSLQGHAGPVLSSRWQRGSTMIWVIMTKIHGLTVFSHAQIHPSIVYPTFNNL